MALENRRNPRVGDPQQWRQVANQKRGNENRRKPIRGPEQKLVLDGARACLDPMIRHRIKALTDGSVDWSLLRSLAEDQGVLPLVYRHVVLENRDRIPKREFAQFQRAFDANAVRSLYLANELVRIVAKLGKLDIGVIAFKGPTLAWTLHGDICLRQYSDLDVFVREHEVDSVCDVLRSLGYEDTGRMSEGEDKVHRRYGDQYEYLRSDRKVIVEPHWAFTPHMLALDMESEGFFRRAKAIAFEGQEILMLEIRDLVLVLMIHGAKHLWERVQLIADVSGCLRLFNTADYSVLLARSSTVGCERIVLVGCLLANRVMGVELWEEVRVRIALDQNVAVLADEVEANLFEPKGELPGPFRWSSFRYRIRERWQDRMRYTMRTLFTPSHRHVRMVPRFNSAPIGFFYVARILHDYVALATWRLGKHFLRK